MAKRKLKRVQISTSYRLGNRLVPLLLMALSLVVLIYILNVLNFDLIHGAGASVIIFASFGGSAFLLFMAPNTKGGHISRFVKSYAAAAILGEIGYFVLPVLGIYLTSAIIISALALVLEGTDSIHTPAVSLAFAFIIYRVGFDGIVLVATAVIVLILVRVFLEKFFFVIERDAIKEVKKIRGRR